MLPCERTYSAASSQSSIVAAALEEHRMPRLPDLDEEVEVAHVPRADLEHVDAADAGLDVPRVGHLGHGRDADGAARLAQHAQALDAEAAERVGARARLVRAAAEDVGARGLHG